MGTPAHERLEQHFTPGTNGQSGTAAAGGGGGAGTTHDGPQRVEVDEATFAAARQMQQRIDATLDDDNRQRGFPWATTAQAGSDRSQRLAAELKSLRAGMSATRFVRRVAAELVEWGKAGGRAEVAAAARRHMRARISEILDEATRQMPDASASDTTLEQWRDGRRLLFVALSQWRDHAASELHFDAPHGQDATVLLQALIREAVRPEDEPTWLDMLGARLEGLVDFVAAVAVVVEQRRSRRVAARGDD